MMDRSRQLEELDSLKNIYYSEEFQVLENCDECDKIQAIFWAFCTLPDNYEVKYLQSLNDEESSCLKVKYLPPIELRLTLPDDYPSKSPPNFVISCKWLNKSKISDLCRKLDGIWKELGPVEILYSWCDFLRNDSLTFLGYDKELDLTFLCLKHLSFIQNLQRSSEKKEEQNVCKEEESNLSTEVSINSQALEGRKDSADLSVSLVQGLRDISVKEDHSKIGAKDLDARTRCQVKDKSCSSRKDRSRLDARAVLDLSLKISPLKILENYNTERKRVEFLRNFFTCNICFSDKMGKDCTQFKDCKHVFCINCIRSYFTVRIKDGTVQSIKCPEEKCTAEALPSQVKEIVSEELFAMYDSVLLSTALDTLNDIIYCPRQFCQYPVSWEPEEKMASCPNCHYVFCVTCKMVYHGVEPCQTKQSEARELVEQYENGSAEVRQQMESRHGKKYLEFLVNNSKAEAWIKENSKACPRCEAAIEKSQGCNKMVCWKCNASFCWLCCQILDSMDSYSHFSDPKSRCVNKLFHLVYDIEEEYEEEYEEDWDWVDPSDDEISDHENFYFD